MPRDQANRLPIATTDTIATVEYESSHGGRIEKRGPVIYQYDDSGEDPRSVHILLDADRVLAASTTTDEVRTVAVEETHVEELSETPGAEGLGNCYRI